MGWKVVQRIAIADIFWSVAHLQLRKSVVDHAVEQLSSPILVTDLIAQH
jgi:hypothetical protein